MAVAGSLFKGLLHIIRLETRQICERMWYLLWSMRPPRYRSDRFPADLAEGRANQNRLSNMGRI